jgi:hypothetical protein
VRLGYRFNGVAVAATFDFGLRPDHFTFIAVRDFHDHDYAHRRLAPTEVTRIYNHTTVINNYVVNNNTVINQGIRPEQVASATHTEIHKVAIRNVSAPSAAVAASRGGSRGELAVYRPALKAPARPVNIVAQKVDQNHPVIHQPAPIATTTQRPLVATSAPNLDRSNPNRGSQGSSTNPGRGPAPGQTQAPPRANVPSTQVYKAPPKAAAEIPSRPQAMSPHPAANQPSDPSRSAPNTPDNHGSVSKGNPQAGEGRAKSTQANPRPAERGNANGRENGSRDKDGRRNDQ